MAIVYYRPLSTREYASQHRAPSRRPEPAQKPKRKLHLGRVLLLIILVGSVLAWRAWPKPSPAPNTLAIENVTAVEAATTVATNSTSATSSRLSTYSTNDPASLWMIVNKKHPLAKDFVPSGLVKMSVDRDESTAISEQTLRQELKTPLENMFAAAKKASHPFRLVSGYRSYDVQNVTYTNFVQSYSQDKADTFSARPGYSEHQMGLALDLANLDGTCQVNDCFGKDAGGIWLAEHAYEYGFIIRYPKDKETETGYSYEPWHLRFVGTELAAELHATGMTMEEYFGVSGGSY